MPFLRNFPVEIDAILCESQNDYRFWLQSADLVDRRSKEQQLVQQFLASGEPFALVTGFCAYCQKPSHFLLDATSSRLDEAGNLVEPNWRERLICSRCNLNNRNRFLWSCLADYNTTAAVWFEDQGSSMLPTLKSKFSELRYWPSDTTMANNAVAQPLSAYAPASFELAISLELFNEIPDLASRLTQIQSALTSNGELIATFSFDRELASTITTGASTKIFGWDILAQCKVAGFRDAQIVFGWSEKYAQYGPEQSFLYATK